jgi:hypothetical protein
MGLTKRELVEYVRMAEHNQEVAEETLKQQAENVKDWVPVVRCKDCKRWKYDAKRMAGLCKRHINYTAQYEFCSYGERREGE